MRYSLQIKKSALNEIKSLRKTERLRVIEAIDRLVDRLRGKPRPSGLGQERGRSSRPIWCV